MIEHGHQIESWPARIHFRCDTTTRIKVRNTAIRHYDNCRHKYGRNPIRQGLDGCLASLCLLNETDNAAQGRYPLPNGSVASNFETPFSINGSTGYHFVTRRLCPRESVHRSTWIHPQWMCTIEAPPRPQECVSPGRTMHRISHFYLSEGRSLFQDPFSRPWSRFSGRRPDQFANGTSGSAFGP